MYKIILATILFIPLTGVQAQSHGIVKLAQTLMNILQDILLTLTGVAIVAFLWNVLQFFVNANNDQKRSDAKKFMVFGVITIFVLVSVWAFVGLLGDTFGFEENVLLPALK